MSTELRDRMVRKAQPTPSAVHVDRPLTNMSLAIMQEESAFIADRVFPNIPVSKQSDLFRTYPRGAFNRNQMKKRAPGTETAGVGYETSTTPYYAHVWGLHHDIDEQTEENADEEVDLDFEATSLLSMQALINRDANWASAFFTTGVWANDTTPGTLWSAANSTPLEDIEARRMVMLESTGKKPNTIVMGPRVWSILKNHAQLVDRMNRGQTSGPAEVLLRNFAELVEVPRVLVAESIVNTAAEGIADAHSFIFGKHLLLLHVAERPGRYTASAGYTFSWRGLSGSNVAGTRISRFEDIKTRSRRIEIESAYSQQKISADLGQFLNGVVA
jgi:hypothetical protein